jgi:hypothetical protein
MTLQVAYVKSVPEERAGGVAVPSKFFSAKRVVSQRKGEDLSDGEHDGCIAKTFARINSRTFLTNVRLGNLQLLALA